jgi:hypothetical protein
MQAHVMSQDPALAQKVWILEDAMSPVPPPPIHPLPPDLDFPRIAEQAMLDFKQSGMNIVRTTDPIVF